MAFVKDYIGLLVYVSRHYCLLPLSLLNSVYYQCPCIPRRSWGRSTNGRCLLHLILVPSMRPGSPHLAVLLGLDHRRSVCYHRAQLSRKVLIFWAAGAFGGLLAFAIEKMAGWVAFVDVEWPDIDNHAPLGLATCTAGHGSWVFLNLMFCGPLMSSWSSTVPTWRT